MKNRTYNRCSQIVSTVRRVFAGETDREHSNIALDRPASSSAVYVQRLATNDVDAIEAASPA